MFGFVTANYDKLSPEAQDRYKAYYCGLCRCIGQEYGNACRMSLNYDMTFMTLILSSVGNTEDETGEGRCLIHPLRKRPYIINENTRYAADMNMILTYYSMMDHWSDDRNLLYNTIGKLLLSSVNKAKLKHFSVFNSIKRHLEEISAVEKASVMNPDVPADIFGSLLGDIFSRGNGDNKELYGFGKALGKFVYIADAVVDLKDDIKKERYHPLVLSPRENFEGILNMLMADCTEKYGIIREKLGCRDAVDLEIIENILYSGVWTALENKKSAFGKENADK